MAYRTDDPGRWRHRDVAEGAQKLFRNTSDGFGMTPSLLPSCRCCMETRGWEMRDD